MHDYYYMNINSLILIAFPPDFSNILNVLCNKNYYFVIANMEINAKM